MSESSRRRRRRSSVESGVFQSPRASPAHLQRIERYRELVEERGWIFAPPSPPRPLSYLFTYLSNGQLESLAG